MGIVISGQSNYGRIRTARDSHITNLLSIIRTAATTATVVGSSRMVPSAHATTPSTLVLAELNSVEVAAEIILTHCTTMLSAARTTGRLLYRGEPVFLTQGVSGSSVSSYSTINSSSVATSLSAMMEKCPLLLSAPPDLLDISTYTNPAAADFFQTISTALEQQQQQQLQQQSDKSGTYGKYVATPRNGHLATPDILEASKWGPVVSVWPLDTLHYTILSTGRQVDR